MMSSQKDKTLKTNVMLRFGFWEAKAYLQTYIGSIEMSFLYLSFTQASLEKYSWCKLSNKFRSPELGKIKNRKTS